MSQAYINAVWNNLPSATIVFDRFHIVKLMNDKLSQLRRELHREVKDQLQKKVLKGTRWLLLKHPDNLSDERDERRRLKEALELNAPLATAYYLKEDLGQIWEQENRQQAKRILDRWISQALASGIRLLIQMANTLQKQRGAFWLGQVS